MRQIKRWTGIAIAVALLCSSHDAFGQSHYATKQAQDSYDSGLRFERQAEEKSDSDYFERAYAAYKNAIEAEPNMVSAYVRLGYLAYALKRSDEGIEYLARAMSVHPDNVELKQYLGLNYFQAGKLDKAEALLEEVIAKRQDLPEAYFVLGKIQLDRGASAASQMNFERYAALSPNDAQAYRALSQAYIQAQNVDGAEESLTKLLTMAPNDVIATINMGHVKFERGQAEEAVKYYEQAYELEPRRHELLYTMASAYYLTGRYAEAIKRFERVLERDKDHMGALYFVADSELKLGHLDVAETKFKALQVLMPDYRYIKLKLAYIRMLRGDVTAIDEVKQLIEQSDRPDDLHFGAVMLRKEGFNEDSMAIHRRLYELDSQNVDFGIFLARDYLENKDYTQAVDLLNSIIDSNTRHNLAWEMLSLTILNQGVDAMMLGDFEQARGHFEQALTMEVHATEAHCSLAQIAILEGETDEAFSSFQAAEQLASDDPNVVKLAAQFDIMDAAYSYAVKRLEDLYESQSSDALGGAGWYLMAVAQSSLGKWKEAEHAIEQAEKYGVIDAPANAVVALQNAMLALSEGQDEYVERNLSRVEQFKEGLEADDKIRYDYLSAIVDIRRKKYSQAKSSLESVMSKFSSLPLASRKAIVAGGNLDVSFELAYVYYETGNYESALSLVSGLRSSEAQALEIAIRRKLGPQALRNKKYDAAIDNYERLSALGANTPADQYNLIVAQLMAAKLTNADVVLDRFAKQNIPEAVLNYAIFLDKANESATATRYYEKYVSMTSARRSESVRKMLSTKQRVWGSGNQ